MGRQLVDAYVKVADRTTSPASWMTTSSTSRWRWPKLRRWHRCISNSATRSGKTGMWPGDDAMEDGPGPEAGASQAAGSTDLDGQIWEADTKARPHMKGCMRSSLGILLPMSKAFSIFRIALPVGKLNPTASPRHRGARRAVDCFAIESRIERVIKAGMPETLLVIGEMSNCKSHGSSGHVYFT